MKSMTIGNRLRVCAALAMLGGGTFGEEALVRLNLVDGGVRTERVALEAVSPTHVRFTYPKGRII